MRKLILVLVMALCSWCVAWASDYMRLTFENGSEYRFKADKVVRVDIKSDSLGRKMIEIVRVDDNPISYYTDLINQISYEDISDSYSNDTDVSGVFDGYEYVDMGISSARYWATCNVGAVASTQKGDFFAWGEIFPKTTYEWENYRWHKDTTIALMLDTVVVHSGKYSDWYSSALGFDGVGWLDEEDDAASMNWGQSWYMPTADQISYLVEACAWSYETNYKGSGVSGCLGVSKHNGRTIFFPCALPPNEINEIYEPYEYGVYWSKEIPRDYIDMASHVTFIDEYRPRMDKALRYKGMFVRPVLRLPKEDPLKDSDSEP